MGLVVHRGARRAPHSAAAGHGAGFNQSNIIETGHVLKLVFAHLGIEMRAYNFAKGGLGMW